MIHDRSDLTRRAMLTAAGASLVSAASPVTGVNAMMSKRPNILWLVSEDNNPFIGAYGDKFAHTPHIDALAHRGILYRNAYCTSPVCAPSRFAMLTGINAESCAPAQHMTARAELPRLLKTYPELMRGAGYHCTNLYKTDYNCDVDPKAIWDVMGPEGHWRNAPRDKPFLCVINTGATHESQLCSPVSGRVTPDQIRVPAFLPDVAEIRQDYASYYNLMEKMDAEIGAHLAELEAAGLADDTIIFYYSDNGGVLPRSKRFCYEEGQRVALVVSVPPKWQHLSNQKPGSVVETPVTLLDLPVTLLSIADARRPAQMTGKALLGRRIDAPQTLAFGCRDRMDERYDLIRTVTDGRWRYIRNYMPHRSWAQHVQFQWQTVAGYRAWEAAHLSGTLSATQDRFFQQKPYEELYDLTSDPDEVVNLIGDPRAGEIATRLRKALDAHMVSVNDNGFLAEGMEGEGYFASRDRSRYPLQHLMTLAAAAAQREVRNLDPFINLLRSDVPLIRYWATLGILMLGQEAAPARADLQNIMHADHCPQVQIAAAEAIAMVGDASSAANVLAKLAATDQPEAVRLQAFNALTYIGPAARVVLPIIEEAAADQTFGNKTAMLARFLQKQLAGDYDPMAQGLTVQQCQTQRMGARKFMG